MADREKQCLEMSTWPFLSEFKAFQLACPHGYVYILLDISCGFKTMVQSSLDKCCL